MVPTLLGKKDQRKHDYLCWEFGERGGATAVLKGDWKGVRRNTRKNPDGPIELYNLKNDLAETTNLAENQKALVAEFNAILKREHVSRNNFMKKPLLLLLIGLLGVTAQASKKAEFHFYHGRRRRVR